MEASSRESRVRDTFFSDSRIKGVKPMYRREDSYIVVFYIFILINFINPQAVGMAVARPLGLKSILEDILQPTKSKMSPT